MGPLGTDRRTLEAIRDTFCGLLILQGQAGVCLLQATMSAKNDSPDKSAHPTKDELTCPGRDGRKTTHNDSSTVDANNPPNHGVPTHGVGRFLWECPKDAPISELGDLYREWSSNDQSDLTRWSE